MSAIKETIKIYQDIRQKIGRPELTEELRLYLVGILNKLNEQEKSIGNFQTVREILHYLNEIDPANSVSYQGQDSYYRQEQNEKKGLPQISEFTGLRSAVSGAEIRLSWKVKNFEKIVLLDGQNNILSDDDHFASVFPFATEKIERALYKLVASSADGNIAEARHEITVFPVPLLQVINTPFPAFIDDFNLQLDLKVPVFEISGTLPQVVDALPEMVDMAQRQRMNFFKNKFSKILFNILFPNEFIRAFLKRKTSNDL